MKKTMIILLISLGMIITLTGCGDDWGEDIVGTYDSDDTWAIYWYLCGSDLESQDGAATMDLEEMMNVELPENVKVIIQTGGSSEWMNDTMDASLLQRYVYSGQELELVDEQKQANMGDEKTLEEFLTFCEEEYPADHKMVLFWNHGGGSVGGVACDENYDFDALSLTEMDNAFSTVYGQEELPLELVGFDTCLMATLDTAKVFEKYSSYMVASEELEPGNGWDYNGWLSGLADNPGLDGAQLGKIICDTFVSGCEEYDTADEITLSVIDLGEIDGLLTSFNGLGKEILSSAMTRPSVCGEFARSAQKAENYGGNNNTDGYSNMVDLGDLVKNAVNLLPETADDLLEALDRAVVYKVNGPYRQNASGLSVYYSYNGDRDELEMYDKVAADSVYPHFIEYSISGKVSDKAIEALGQRDYEEASPLKKIKEDMPVEITDENYARLTIDPASLGLVKSVFFNLAYYSEEDDLILFLGRDNDLESDWDSGIFEDNYRGVWGAIDQALCYMEITHEGEDYNLYSIPIYLNGEECVMRVVYDYEEEEFEILGARNKIDEDRLMGDKNLIQIKVGDQVTPILEAMTMEDESDEIYEIADESVLISESSAFEEIELGDGNFAFMFEIVDTSNNSYDSELVLFESVDGEITFLIDE